MKSLTVQALENEALVENPHKELGFGEDAGCERIWSMSDEKYAEAIRVEADK